MKKISFFIVLTSVLLLSACSMDKYPEDKLSPETYFSSAQELKLYTNYFYKLMPTGADLYEEEGDHFVAPVPSRQVQGTRLIPETDDKWNWEVLRKINFYLAHSSNCEDADAREHYDGLAHFFRAYFYFDKVRNYGDVPWYSEVLNSDDKELLTQPRDSRQLVVDSILADLDFAIEHLSATRTPYATQVTRRFSSQ